MRKTRSTGTRRRGRWTAIALAVGVPALVVPYLVLTRDDAEPVQVDSAAYYQFVSVRDGSALDVAGADDADGARIQQEKRATGAASQQWQLKPVQGGFWQLVNHNSGKVLGVRGFPEAEADVEQQSDTGAAAQQWQLLDTGDGRVKIISRDSGMVLGVTGGTDRRAVLQLHDRGGADQRWNLAKAGTAPGLPPGTAVVADRAEAGTFYALSGGTLFAGSDGGKGFTARAGGLAGGHLEAAATYLVGTVKGVTGTFRSTDGGGAGSGVITGDPDVYGRVYVGTNGRGVLYAEPS